MSGKGTNLGLWERDVEQEYGSQLPVKGEPGSVSVEGRGDEKGRADQERKRPSECSNARKAPMTAQYVDSAWRVSTDGEWARALKVA